MLNIGIGIVRTKVFAVLLGPAGFGLMGLYGSIVDLAQSIAGMGVNSSGVRQIAESVGTGDDRADCANRCRAEKNIDLPRSIRRSFTCYIFQTGVNLNLWQRSTCHCRCGVVTRCVFPFSSRWSRGA